MYKVLYIIGGRYYSPIAMHLSDDAIVEYKLGEVSASPWGPIIAFEDLDNARVFKESLKCHADRMVIARVDGVIWNIGYPKYLLALGEGRSYTGLEIKEFWDHPEFWSEIDNPLRVVRSDKTYKYFGYGNIPNGTIYCRWIRLAEILSNV